MEQKDNCIHVTLGVFNKPNVVGQMYCISEEKLTQIMDEKVGKHFGEMEYPTLPKDIQEAVIRLQTVDQLNAAGSIKDYTIIKGRKHDRNAKFPILTVQANIIPTSKLNELINDGVTPYFGIRCLFANESEITNNHNRTFDVYCVGGFDLVPQDPRRSHL